MSVRLSALDKRLRAALLARPVRRGRCPQLGELLSYQQRLLPARSADALQEHISRCCVCARRVLDLARFPRVRMPSGVRPLTRLEQCAERERLRAAILREAAAILREVPVRPRARRPRRRQ